jgi:hypothetical protein
VDSTLYKVQNCRPGEREKKNVSLWNAQGQRAHPSIQKQGSYKIFSVVSWKVEIYKHHSMYILVTRRERKPKGVTQGWVEIKESRDSGTLNNEYCFHTESKDTCSLYNMLALGNFSILLGIQSRCSGGRPY